MSPNLLPNFSEVGFCMAIGFSEWNQRNSDTEHRTEVPNLMGGVGFGWDAPFVCCAGGLNPDKASKGVRPFCRPIADRLGVSARSLEAVTPLT